jgi:hypothetical protein
VPVIISVQPSAEGTSTRFVHTVVEPPSLVIDDGATTVVFSPARIGDGLAEAAEFAQELVQVASEWESGCRRALAAIQPDDPFNVDALVIGHDGPPRGDGDRG